MLATNREKQYLQVSVLLQDILHMLVGVNAVVICKFNPVLDYLGPFAECVPSTHFPAAPGKLLLKICVFDVCVLARDAERGIPTTWRPISHCRQALAPLVEQGYVSFVYGGAEQGKFVSNHRLVTKIHLTGSAATYDAIVWGGKAKARLLTAAQTFQNPQYSKRLGFNPVHF